MANKNRAGNKRNNRRAGSLGLSLAKKERHLRKLEARKLRAAWPPEGGRWKRILREWSPECVLKLTKKMVWVYDSR